MNLKWVLLDCMLPEQLKALCNELDVEADRRSASAMFTALTQAKRAKPERMLELMTVVELREALARIDAPTEGKREVLVERLLVAGGRRAPNSEALVLNVDDPRPSALKNHDAEPRARVLRTGDSTEQYRHAIEAVQRPDAGVQDQFQAKKPPRTYRYDSSLDPALYWDEQRERDLGRVLARRDRAYIKGARQRLLTATFPYYELKSPQTGPAGGFVYKRKQNRKGEEIGGLVPHITLKSIANDEPPAMEVLVDRPEEASSVTRVAGPFVVEATIAPVQALGTAGDDAEAASGGDAATHIQRMTEVLRQSKTLRLPGNRELTLSAVRRTVDTEYLHAEASEGDKRIAIVFGPADGAVSATLVYEAGREAHYLKYERLYFFGFAVEPGARAMIEDEKKRGFLRLTSLSRRTW